MKKEIFGRVNNQDVYKFSLNNKNGIELQLLNYGGALVSLEVPGKNNDKEDILLGYDTLSGYIHDDSYLGTLIGRYGNRIAHGKFKLDGIEYDLACNHGQHHLHGGNEGFNKKVWEVETSDNQVKLFYLSPDGEEGYPGNLQVTVIYTLNEDNELSIYYEAKTDKKTHLNLTNHAYFNLTGCKENILGHEIKINADRYTEVDELLIPTGKTSSVNGTPLDIRKYTKIGERISSMKGGFDHNYILSKGGMDSFKAAEVKEEKSGRCMEVFTTEPAIQFYSGNSLREVKGKNNKIYSKHDGFCLETQHYPDSPNHPHFPSTLLYPGDIYKQETIYKFKL